MVATKHMWLLKFKLNKIKNSVLQPHVGTRQVPNSQVWLGGIIMDSTDDIL